MKKLNYQAKTNSLSLFILFILFSSPLCAQQLQPLSNGYFVVVSTFKDSQAKEAKGYSELLNKRGFKTNYGLEESKHFLYVYLESFNYDQFRQSIDRMQVARAKDGFPTAWVLKIKDGKEIKEGEPIEQERPKVEPKPIVSETPSLVTEYIPNPTPLPVYKPHLLANTPVFFSVIRKSDKKVVDGTVKIVDAENNRVLGTVKANAYFNVPDPKSKSGRIGLVASVFGFNEASQEMNYKDTERDTLKQEVILFGNFYMITFEMERLASGAKATLSGISFFNDAAIMVPSSREQLNGLLDMLAENPQMRIRIEGHTNGNSRGDIISMGPSKNYFALAKDKVTKSGSAKELSEARAEVIKNWLIDQGIAASRIETIGYGGSKPLHDSKSNLARKNSRVELEVIN
jgi:outer membrane protein OmpA-like peptidoglycan-associated protein